MTSETAFFVAAQAIMMLAYSCLVVVLFRNAVSVVQLVIPHQMAIVLFNHGNACA